MRTLGVMLLTLVFAIPATSPAGDAPPGLKALAGTWSRPAVQAADGKGMVVPRLFIKAEGKDWFFNAGAEREMGDEVIIRTARYTLKPKEEGEAVLTMWLDKTKEIQFRHKIKGDTLTIMCKQKLLAGKFLEEYDISGEWKRSK